MLELVLSGAAIAATIFIGWLTDNRGPYGDKYSYKEKN